MDEATELETPAVHRLTGTFVTPVLERAFRKSYETEIRNDLTLSYVAAIVLLGAFGVVDYIMVPTGLSWTWGLRYGLLIPLLMGSAILSRRPWYGAYHDAFLVAAIGATLAVVVVGGLLSPDPARALYLSSATTFPLVIVAFRARVATVAFAGALTVATLAISGVSARVEPRVVFFLASNAVAMSSIGAIAARAIEGGARKTFLEHRELELERARSERLLANMLPASIANRLRGGEQVIADRVTEVSVLFADVVGFTAFAARLSPERVVEVLNELFSEFDTLADRHGVEKIKTIGDAYMVAAGIPTPSDDHARILASMALDMLAVVARVSESLGEPLQVRAGIHTGPVVAGVIGQRKLSYDLWGDTVNTAARLESHGLPGRIQISAATRHRLANSFRCEARGTIELKGKGPCEAWFLLGRSEA